MIYLSKFDVRPAQIGTGEDAGRKRAIKKRIKLIDVVGSVASSVLQTFDPSPKLTEGYARVL